MPNETQLTRGAGGRILTNVNVWSADGNWIAYDTRSDAAGEVFDGTRIEAVHTKTHEVRELYESKNGAKCGVVTWHPIEPKVAFILGPEHPTVEWSYGPSRRRGVIVDSRKPGVAIALDARDLVPPFTPGALRGGSHVHVFSPDGEWLSFTYEDQYLLRHETETATHDANLRNVGISVPAGLVKVSGKHPRNRDGTYFSVLATRTTANPVPGSDEIQKAFEEAAIGTNGYLRRDGTRQKRALAFQGHVRTATGSIIAEVFVVDIPDDVRTVGDGPLQGTETRRPFPPKGTTQRRLTHTAHRKFPGIRGPRHWLRSSPDGARIAFLMHDDIGMAQLATISPNGGDVTFVTQCKTGVASAFTWDVSGERIAFIADGCVCVVDVATGKVTTLTEPAKPEEALRPEACVFSPSGKQIAFVRRHNSANQICIVDV